MKKSLNSATSANSLTGETVLDSINLDIYDNEFLTLLGPSGCGKTTTLRMIGGFETPDQGDILFLGERINDIPPHKRNINTVFQRYALFPHLNVFENVAFPLREQKLPAQRDRAEGQRDARARQAHGASSAATSRACPADSSSASPLRARS